jgi:cell division protein FtsN
MEDRAVESGLELVLDNKKLIIAFLVLSSVCCFFWVLGFVEGKRQGFREGTQSAAVPVSSASFAGAPIKEGSAAVSSETNAPEKDASPETRPLNWYKNVNQAKEEAKIESPPKKKAEEPADKSKSQILPATPITYSVQVGAFSQKHEAELKAQSLKSKGFDYRIESPHPPEQLYLLKVGKFDSRADAGAMQLRLRKSGFACFVKVN